MLKEREKYYVAKVSGSHSYIRFKTRYGGVLDFQSKQACQRRFSGVVVVARSVAHFHPEPVTLFLKVTWHHSLSGLLLKFY